MLTSEVENFPGFKEGILGPDLMDNIWKQAERFGAEFVFEQVDSVDLSSKPFGLKTEANEYEARSIIIATGASARWLGLESEERLRGKGLSVCATCDAAFYDGRSVVVVGGGDSALEEALALAKFASEVRVIHRRDQLRASQILQERSFANEKIEFIWNSSVVDILGEDKVEGVKIKNSVTGEESTLQCDGVFMAIGHKPNTDLFKDQVDLDGKGYVVAQDMTKTSVPGVFVAGDAHDSVYRQAILSAGTGCKAALDAQKFLEEE
jgi:thioredoxin reductase (NADPH)